MGIRDIFSADQKNYVRKTPRELRLAKLREKKIERKLEKYPNVDTDEIERWVSEDDDDIQSFIDDQKRFFEQLEEHGNIPIKSTGKVWYHSERRIGRIFESIHNVCDKDSRGVILAFIPNHKNVYRLTVPDHKVFPILSQAIKQGYILSEMVINYMDVNKL